MEDQPDDIVKIFAAMASVTTTELKNLRESNENHMEPDDAFIDFATEDFINKNIRVRPVSGITNRDDKDGRASNFSKGDAEEDGNEHYNKIALFELES